MSLVNCPLCGKLFVRTTRNMCPDCLAKEQSDFEKVKDCLYENPGANVEQISEITGVSAKRVIHFLKEGRLELSEDNKNLLLKCEACGEPIRTGRFCESCVKKLSTGFSSVGNKHGYIRMHTADLRKMRK
jgi:flagellar operon protein (TIGR03826 family)